MISWDVEQQSIANSPYKRGSWLFQINCVGGAEYCWSTKAKLWDGKGYRPKVLPESFTGVRLSMSGGRMRMVAPNEVIFRVANADADDYRGATVLISALLSDGTNERVMSAFKMRVKGSPKSVMGCRQFVCEDFLQQHLRGAYPNSRNPYDLFPSIDAAGGLDAVCVPKIWGTAYIPLRPVLVPNALTLTGTTISFVASSSGANCKIQDSGNGLDIFEVGRNITISGSTSNNISATVLSVSAGELELPIDAGITTEAAGDTVTIVQSTRYYLLGPTGPTYSPTQIHSPGELGLTDTWDSTEYTFAQTTITDGESSTWKGFRPIVVDIDNDGTADDAIFWRPSDKFLDMPTKFSRSDTASMTGPEEVIADIWEDFGVPAADIDVAETFAAAGVVYSGWGLEWNGGFYFQQDREGVISLLHSMCHSCFQISDKIELHPLSAASVATIERTDIIRRTWRPDGSAQEKNRPDHQPAFKADVSDSAYIAWMESGKPQDRRVQNLVDIKSVKTNYSDEVLDLPFVQNSIHCQKLGRLFWQREFLADGSVTSFFLGAKYMKLRPQDMVTIDWALCGGTYDFRIDDVFIHSDFSVEVSGTAFSDELDDWGDLSYSAITLYSDDAQPKKYYTSTIGGPLSDKIIGASGFDVWGRPYIILAQDKNRGDYTDFQGALNALLQSRYEGILVRIGEYTLPTTFFPNRNLFLHGESQDGVIFKNTAGSNLFTLHNLTKTIELSNFTIQSQNTSWPGTSMIYCYGDTAAENTSSLLVDKVTLNLTDNGASGSTFGDFGVRCSKGEGQVTVSGCRSDNGCQPFSFYDYNRVLIESCRRIIDSKYAGIRMTDVDDWDILANVIEDFGLRGIEVNGDGVRGSIASNKIKARSANTAGPSGIIFVGTTSGPRSVAVTSNDIEIVSSGNIIARGIFWQKGSKVRIAQNDIYINVTSTQFTQGIIIVDVDDSTLIGNTVEVDNDDNTASHYGIQTTNMDDSCIGHNNVNMINSDAKDISFYFSASSSGLRGSGNISLNAGTDKTDLGGNNVEVNGA